MFTEGLLFGLDRKANSTFFHKMELGNTTNTIFHFTSETGAYIYVLKYLIESPALEGVKVVIHGQRQHLRSSTRM